jgi:hypothetical protein
MATATGTGGLVGVAALRQATVASNASNRKREQENEDVILES